MDLVAGAVGSVIAKLGELLHEEYKLQKGLPEKIESLKHELESAQMALSKVGEVPPEQLDPQVRLWASEVREASYDMEDILDTFLVIDDVWDITTWNIIKSALVNNGTGSRVITTTRNGDVASKEEVYELRTLSPDHSEKLFKTRLFGVNGEYPPHHPTEESEKILKKCGGVPLAIITMASLLVGKLREDWVAVCNSPGFYRRKGNQQVDDTEWILSLSYYDLPSYLRTCLLYLSVYPEDYGIEKDSLIWKWIAEGFVEKKTGTSLFQQGEEYFNQLINRSMIQAVESEILGEVYGCRVHDMVLDLICDLSYKENFVTISNDDEGTLPHQNKVRRFYNRDTAIRRLPVNAVGLSTWWALPYARARWVVPEEGDITGGAVYTY
ncbi:putative disease resistance protein At1g50180 [Setaria italica]|uniref:putative disease resistance protein At1g50180 n=1 Tax=Setaria italica TaxID=4555 RepID=UPI00035099FD|nr:putative disease resistance protein At1g50180 [Setaria italica]